MGFSMFSAQSPPIAIDFGTSSVKLLQLSSGATFRSRSGVCNFGRAPTGGMPLGHHVGLVDSFLRIGITRQALPLSHPIAAQIRVIGIVELVRAMEHHGDLVKVVVRRR